MSNTHWEIDSNCPQCGSVNHVSVPVGEKLVVVQCRHCTHAYDYLHVVTAPQLVEDED